MRLIAGKGHLIRVLSRVTLKPTGYWGGDHVVFRCVRQSEELNDREFVCCGPKKARIE